MPENRLRSKLMMMYSIFLLYFVLFYMIGDHSIVCVAIVSYDVMLLRCCCCCCCL